jgi:hypothetical protein
MEFGSMPEMLVDVLPISACDSHSDWQPIFDTRCAHSKPLCIEIEKQNSVLAESLIQVGEQVIDVLDADG